VERNDAGEIADRTRELLRLLVDRNGLRAEDVASAVFTVTSDLDAAFPTVAARPLPGWEQVPLLCSREIPVPGSLARCIRVLIHWNTERPQAVIHHVFLRGARVLRPEWAVRVDVEGELEGDGGPRDEDPRDGRA
jgi:chorismate mutase